jgi:high-affinity nickel permease
MTNFPNLGAAALRRAGFVALLVWAAGGLLDGATLGELVGVPVLVAAWMSAVLLIDRLIMRRHRGWSINSAG